MELEERYLTPAQREKLSPGLKMGIIKKKMNGMSTMKKMKKTKTKRKTIPMAMKNYGK
jgi:hypothetical protein